VITKGGNSKQGFHKLQGSTVHDVTLLYMTSHKQRCLLCGGDLNFGAERILEISGSAATFVRPKMSFWRQRKEWSYKPGWRDA